MAKKKRRLARRPRPETRAATAAQGTPEGEERESSEKATVGETAGEESAESDESLVSDEMTPEVAADDSAEAEEAAGDERAELDAPPEDDVLDAPEGDVAEGDVADNDAADGDDVPDAPEGDVVEGDVADNDAADGDDAPEGDVAEGDAAEGDVAEGDVAEGDVQGVNAADGEIESSEEEELDVERSFEDFVRSDDDDEEAPADSGPGLIGEGVEIDEAEVEDTEHFLKGLVEAILFSSDKPQDAKEVARAARIDKRRAQELIELLIEDTKNRGVRLCAVSDGFAYRTNPAYSSYVREFLSQRPVRLSRAQLETLAIIAYRQPLTRPEVDDIRGVDTGAVIKLLLERDLIRILGKKDEPGRPMIYGTTPQFLDLFSLTSLRDLPTLREFTELNDDSRAKFEMEIGEPAPEGAIEFPEDVLSGDAEAATEQTVIEGEESEEPQSPAAGEIAAEGEEDLAIDGDNAAFSGEGFSDGEEEEISPSTLTRTWTRRKQPSSASEEDAAEDGDSVRVSGSFGGRRRRVPRRRRRRRR